MITASAPGCCSLVGDPSDFVGGSVLACSTRERARCALSTDADGITIRVLGQSQGIQSAADLALRDGDILNIARAVLVALEVSPGQTPPFQLSAETDIPREAGLGGPTALLATITGCLLIHLELRLNLYEIAELIRKIEYDYLGLACGFQDHYMTVFGGVNFLDFRDKNIALPQDPTTPFATVEPLDRFVNDLPLVVAHAAGAPSSGRREGVSAGQEEYVELGRLARAAKRALLARDWDAFADQMNRSHALRRGLGPGEAADERLIAAALTGGADGAKWAGSGDGGVVVALTHDPERTLSSLRAAGAETILHPHPCPGLTVAVEVTVP